MITLTTPIRSGALVGALVAALPAAARADDEVFLPLAEEGDWEPDNNGSASFDRNRAKSGLANATVEVGDGVSSWYHPVLSRAPAVLAPPFAPVGP
jgi:hypothetical protein